MRYSDNDSAILSALRSGEALTPLIANERWGCLALHSAIARLRKAGHKISTRMVNGHGEYRILRQQEGPGAHGKAVPQDAPKVTTEKDFQGRPAGAAPLSRCTDHWEAGQIRISFGRKVQVIAAGFSAHDGTAFCEVRDLGPA